VPGRRSVRFRASEKAHSRKRIPCSDFRESETFGLKDLLNGFREQVNLSGDQTPRDNDGRGPRDNEPGLLWVSGLCWPDPLKSERGLESLAIGLLVVDHQDVHLVGNLPGHAFGRAGVVSIRAAARFGWGRHSGRGISLPYGTKVR